jgi:hypothetical protein
VKPETFDIETGMAVYGANGEKIGRVAEIAGFGSTRIAGRPDDGATELVIQAKTGSGYFNVDRREVSGADVGSLCVPFRGIAEVVPDHGVTLNDTIIEELRRQGDPRPIKQMSEPTVRRRRWPKWL